MAGLGRLLPGTSVAVAGPDWETMQKTQTFLFAKDSYFAFHCNNSSHSGYDATQQTFAPTQWGAG